MRQVVKYLNLKKTHFQGAIREKIAIFKRRYSVCRGAKIFTGRCVRKSPISKEEAAFAGVQKFSGWRCGIKSPISKKEAAFAEVQKFSEGDP